MSGPLAVLCLDIEGGHGGSSRSLAIALGHLDRSRVEPTVWMRRASWLQQHYAGLGIASRVRPDLPKVSALPRFSRNLAVFVRFFAVDWPRSRGFRTDLLEAADAADVVHFNHEATFWLARWLRRRRPNLPLTMHIRTNLHRSAFARWQCGVVRRAVDAAVFITANERTTFAAHAPLPARHAVILNPVAIADSPAAPHPALCDDGRFRIGVLANYSPGRGLDRLVAIAAAMDARDRAGVRFVVAGDMGGPDGGALAAQARAAGVADCFQFLGHVDAPEAVLAGLDLLIKPTREANPWGRDIIEAMAAGVPVMSFGTDATFVETGTTGWLFDGFDAGQTAAALTAASHDRPLCARLGAQARARVAALCDPSRQAGALAALWNEIRDARAAERRQ
ncbi:MAG: glycosyltransferase family 4 protein [Alphaproteobacteria bacterium]